jgi:Acetyltransferase (GNAT) domain
MGIMFDASPSIPELLPLPQSAPYAVASRACGASVFSVELGCGWAQVVERGRVRLISRGPVWDTGADMASRRRALRRLARWPGLTVATPEQDLRGLGLIPLITPMHHAIWDLSGDVRARLGRKWRGHLNATERAGITISPARPGTFDQLVAQESRQRRIRRYVSHPQEFHHALPKADLRVWEWQHRGGISAAMAIVVHGTSASYHIAWADMAARKAGVHTAMLWHAARALWGEGVHWLDLGSVNHEQAPGLATFKLGTGARLHRLGPTVLVLPG